MCRVLFKVFNERITILSYASPDQRMLWPIIPGRDSSVFNCILFSKSSWFRLSCCTFIRNTHMLECRSPLSEIDDSILTYIDSVKHIFQNRKLRLWSFFLRILTELEHELLKFFISKKTFLMFRKLNI